MLLIKARDRDALAHYAQLCIDNVYPRIQSFFSPTLTKISLVQGDALGGGFECALASDVIVAEESAQLGFPRSCSTCSRAWARYSLLARRIGMRRRGGADPLRQASCRQQAARDGRGRRAGEGRPRRDRGARVDRDQRHGAATACRRRSAPGKVVHPITREELDAITDVWVDAAFRLQDRDLKMMGPDRAGADAPHRDRRRR